MVKEIKVCMGSACFAKGNQENLEFIKKYISDNNLDLNVAIVGALCENKCHLGPRVYVDGVEHTQVTKEKLEILLDEIK